MSATMDFLIQKWKEEGTLSPENYYRIPRRKSCMVLLYVYRGWLKIWKTACVRRTKELFYFPGFKKIKNGHRRPPYVVSFRFCMGRSLCYVLLNFLIKFVKQRARAVSSCCLDPHLPPYFLHLCLQLELLCRTGQNIKIIRPLRCFFRIKWDTFMMFSIEFQI